MLKGREAGGRAAALQSVRSDGAIHQDTHTAKENTAKDSGCVRIRAICVFKGDGT